VTFNFEAVEYSILIRINYKINIKWDNSHWQNERLPITKIIVILKQWLVIIKLSGNKSILIISSTGQK
jgi:hypothetical protein